MNRVNKITIEYESETKLVVTRSPTALLKWWHELAIPRWDGGNNLDRAMVQVQAQFEFPTGTTRTFVNGDSVI